MSEAKIRAAIHGGRTGRRRVAASCWLAFAIAWTRASSGCSTAPLEAETSPVSPSPRIATAEVAAPADPAAHSREPDATRLPAPTLPPFAKDLDPAAGSLREQLVVEAMRAHRDGRRAFVEMRANWCAVCKRVDRRLAAPSLHTATAGIVVIRVDTDAWADELDDAGLRSPTIPTFYALDRRGQIHGRELRGHGLRSTEQIDAALRAFLTRPVVDR